MTPSPVVTLQPPPPVGPRVLHLDTLGVELPYLAPHYDFLLAGHVELRGTTHQVPAVVVRRGTL